MIHRHRDIRCLISNVVKNKRLVPIFTQIRGPSISMQNSRYETEWTCYERLILLRESSGEQGGRRVIVWLLTYLRANRVLACFLINSAGEWLWLVINPFVLSSTSQHNPMVGIGCGSVAKILLLCWFSFEVLRSLMAPLGVVILKQTRPLYCDSCIL